MPFITEEIWQTLPHEGETIMLAKFPEFTSSLDYPEARQEMEVVMNAIRAIRTRRSEMNVPPSRKAKVYIATEQKETFEQTFTDLSQKENGAPFICKLASASEVEVGSSFDLDGAVTVVTAEAKIYIPMNELVDKEEELSRLNKELAKTEKMLAQSEGKLNNQGFIGKAPANVVEKVKMQAEKEREKIAMIKAAIDALQ